MSRSTFRRDIQGLRAIGVLTVVIFHAWPSFLPGGFVGVDIFFVISGFLIGGILKRDILEGELSLFDFYRKRVRRIFPALFVMLAATLILGAFLLGPVPFKELGRTTVSATLFLSNVDFYRFSGYFDPAAELRPLLHTWSLSVEEQFYLVFPIILLLILRFAPRLLIPSMFVATLALLLLSQWALARAPMAAYFLSPYRGFELLLGVMASYAPAPRKKHQSVDLIGVGLIIVSLVFLTPDVPFPGFVAFVPTLGAALLLWSGRLPSEGLVTRALSSQPMFFFGAISYSLYLWHWPLMAYVRITSHREPGFVVMFAVVLLSILCGWLSWKFVEQRFAHAPIRRAPILVAGVSAMIVFAGVGGVIWARDGVPSRFPPEAIAYFESENEYSPWRAACHQEDSRRVPYQDTCILGAKTGQRDAGVVVWGDSHGTELSAALAEEIPVRQVTASACPPVVGVDFPLRPNCAAANSEVLDALTEDQQVSRVLLAINREAYATVDSAALRQGYAQVAQSLAKSGKSVVLLAQIPNPHFNPSEAAGRTAAQGKDPENLIFELDGAEEDLALWASLEADLSAQPNIGYHDPAPSLCEDRLCPIASGTEVLYFNETHVSMAGAERIAAALLPLLDEDTTQID